MLTPEFFILFGAGCLIGTFAIVVGGAMFFSVPLMQWLFPEISFGAVVGNIKVGSFFTFAGSTFSTRKNVFFLQNIKLAAFAFPGAVIGASIIAHLDQRWALPAIMLAIALSFLTPKIAHLVTDKTFHVMCFLTGVYGGFFGAGVGLTLFALLRLKYPQDTDIALVKTQVRFIEMLLIIAALITHYIHGNLITAIWLPWAMGGMCGGVVGGLLLNRMGKLPGHVQKYILYTAFSFALIVASIRFF